MANFFRVILAIHILFAVGCALAMWRPLLATKGGEKHRRTGRVYAWLLFLATSTSVIVTGLRYVISPTTLGHGESSPLDLISHDELRYRLFIGFLVFVAITTASAAAFGLRSLSRVDRDPAEGSLHFGVALLGVAITSLGVWATDLPMIAVGAAGTLLALWQARSALYPPADRTGRLREHLTGMICSGIGTYSALMVVLGNRIATQFFHGPYGVIIWLIPTLIGLPLLLWVRLRTYSESYPDRATEESLQNRP